MSIYYEIKLFHVFLFFVALHVVFWSSYFFTGHTLIPGDWSTFWHEFHNKTAGSQYYEQFFLRISDHIGVSLAISIICFSTLNTATFFFFKKIFDLYSTRYSSLAALFLLLSPSSIYFLSGMYKDQISYLAYSIILFIVSRSFVRPSLGISQAYILYFISVSLVLISRPVYLDFLTLILALSLIFALLQLFFTKERFVLLARIKPLVSVVILHILFIGWIHSGSYTFSADSPTSIKEVSLNVEISTKPEGHKNVSVIKKVGSNIERNYFIDKFVQLVNIIKERKKAALNAAPDAELNYNNLHDVSEMQPSLWLVFSHLQPALFPPYIADIWKTQLSGIVKLVYSVETIVNYILVLSFFLLIPLPKAREVLHVSATLLSCALLMSMLDVNFGTYMRHAFVFLELMTGVGLLFILIKFTPDIDFRIKALGRDI